MTRNCHFLFYPWTVTDNKLDLNNHGTIQSLKCLNKTLLLTGKIREGLYEILRNSSWRKRDTQFELDSDLKPTLTVTGKLLRTEFMYQTHAKIDKMKHVFRQLISHYNDKNPIYDIHLKLYRQIIAKISPNVKRYTVSFKVTLNDKIKAQR